eukprot:CAMPEP_0204253970 /NCGR_PEP_ID=MMETSP0468-20130131/2255_1 /ASSEMBLY_ACC=CAM_ASM_000383 /TAXON_ID=2969 /ORGANISM="Oxyrrhis marina" /LENGTH=68 /DNA_ID=CAMNT_0051227649 /DNA_START=27 /DNA_END=229 /DNA_ORIENTATION=-
MASSPTVEGPVCGGQSLLGTSTDPVEPELSPEELEYRDKLLAANSALKKPTQPCPAHWSEARKAATIA